MGNGRIAHPHFKANRDSSQRILHIVAARHGKVDALYRPLRPVAGTDNDVEAVPAGVRGNIFTANVGLRRKTISNDPAVADLGQNRLHFGMVETHDRRAVKWHVFDEFDKGIFDRVKVAIMVKMFRIDVGDNRNRAIQPQEAAVAFVRLNHHPVACTKARVGAVAVDDTAVDDRRINAAIVKHRSNHRCGRRLAMCARHGDRVL